MGGSSGEGCGNGEESSGGVFGEGEAGGSGGIHGPVDTDSFGKGRDWMSHILIVVIAGKVQRSGKKGNYKRLCLTCDALEKKGNQRQKRPDFKRIRSKIKSQNQPALFLRRGFFFQF